MPESKTRAVNFAITYAKYDDTTNEIKLLSIKDSNLGKDKYSLILLSEQDNILLQSNIPVKRNFFYHIEELSCKSDKQSCLTREYGFGEINKKGRNLYLKREGVINFFDGINTIKVTPKCFHIYDKNSILIVKSIVPENYIDIFTYPYSVLCSIEPSTPTPVELEEKTLLGRLDDEIQSIDKDELRSILTDENIISAVSETKDDINLNSKYINLINDNANLVSPVITAKPVHNNSKKPDKPQRGSIIFNTDENCFEGYDGRRWRKLKWGDE